jgi:uncharacterized protein (UPF0335 family)
MTDYIKRIQSRLSSKGINKKRSEIIEEIKSLGYDAEKLSDELSDLITPQLLNKFISCENPDTNLFNSPTNDTPSDSNHPEADEEINKNKLPHPAPESGINKNNSPVFISGEDEINLTEILISPEDKHNLISSQASVLGFTLSEEDATCIAETVDEIFESYTHLIDTISTAIKSYFDHRFDSVESKLGSNSENLREHFASRKEKLNQKIAGFKDDVKADLGGIRNDIKSVQFAFTERLRIPAKT